MVNKKQLWEEFKLNETLMGLVNSEEELTTLTSDQQRISEILFSPRSGEELFLFYSNLKDLKGGTRKW